MTKNRTFTPLSASMGMTIGRCNTLLDNKLQCPREAEFDMLLSDEQGNILEQYQVCLRHKIIIMSQDATAAIADMDKPPTPNPFSSVTDSELEKGQEKDVN